MLLVDRRLLCFFAITITTFVCLLLYLSNAKSRLLNQTTAFTKVVLLLILAGFGAHYLSVHGSHTDDWFDKANTNTRNEWPIAFVIILFSFHGWENATLVSAGSKTMSYQPLILSTGRRGDPLICCITRRLSNRSLYCKRSLPCGSSACRMFDSKIWYPEAHSEHCSAVRLRGKTGSRLETILHW